MNRAEITKLITKNQESITEQIESTLKTHSESTQAFLTQSLANDQIEIKNALKEHRTKIRAYTNKTIKEKMTFKLLDMKYQVIITILLSMNLFLLILMIILIKRI